jgi:GT2 family glycosyltransferase
MTRAEANRPLDTGRPSARPPQSWPDVHIPSFLKRLLPSGVINGLQELKARIITRGFPRSLQFDQSLEDTLASASMSIIVAIHDAPTVTLRCLASLEKYATKAEVILVNDASRLAETREVIDYFGGRNKWKVVHHKNSVGHSEACRTGASLSTRPYLCLLNSDTVVTPWCWRRVKEVFEDDQTIGVAGPSTSNAGNEQSLAVASRFLPYWSDNQICNFAGSLLTDCSQPVVVDLPWISGFAFFIRHDLWEELGGFDRNLPDYGNEVELCKRVAARGRRTVWVRNSYIHHLGRQSYRETIGQDGILARIRAAEIYNKQNNRTVSS